ncbi:hypothetical protein Z043_121569 [Scleropages formosus]|uniref:Immunoglobulin V-set domain-containing protein n=1 Tax=Scleropages formosus TaxID=113540 RepID=A0A0P7U1C5_SCLFO|nr:hypothetical protein Z043_121569 [Scleropages formosus]
MWTITFYAQFNSQSKDSQFRNRTTLFPFQYEKGNFSLLLTDLKNFDTGEYTCFYPKERFVRKVILQVKVDGAAVAPSGPEVSMAAGGSEPRGTFALSEERRSKSQRGPFVPLDLLHGVKTFPSPSSACSFSAIEALIFLTT